MSSANDWTQVCAAILTSTTAIEADRAQCREMMSRAHHDLGWPGAFAFAVFFVAIAWGAPRFIRELV